MDAAGKVQGRDKVMLHHIVFAKVGVPDYTCGGFTERFFAEGEERLALSLPRGYGYANKATDRWALLYMLMNHKPQRLNGFIRYTVRYVTGERLTPVKPVWLDVRNCTGGIDPVFDVPGGGKRFSTFTKTADFTMPEGGRLISGGGHLHGGGVRLELRNATCGTVPFESRPSWGGPKPKPLLHEPGPTKMSAFRSTVGIPVAKGQKLRLAAVYDNQAPHTRAMGIMLLFLAPAAIDGVRRDAGARDRSRQSVRAAAVLDAAAAHAEGTGVDGEVDLRPRLPLRRRARLAEARHDLHVALPGPVRARRHGRRRPGGLLGAVDADRRLQAPLHESRHLSPVLLAAPGQDGAADHRPLALCFETQARPAHERRPLVFRNELLSARTARRRAVDRERDELEAVDVDEPVIGDLQARDHREREERERLERRLDLRPERVHRGDRRLARLDHVGERPVGDEARDRQRQLRGDLAAVDDDEPAAELDEALDGSHHVLVVDADDHEVVRVVREGRGEGAAGASPKPRTKPSPIRPVPRWRSITAILARSRSGSASAAPSSACSSSTSASVTIWPGTRPITRARPPSHGTRKSVCGHRPHADALRHPLRHRRRRDLVDRRVRA